MIWKKKYIQIMMICTELRMKYDDDLEEKVYPNYNDLY